MDAATSPTSLPEKLQEVLREIPSPDFANRLEKVYQAAAHAVERLTDIDLLRYESNTVEDSADLSLWEEMAPVIRDTVLDVNALLTVLRAMFPEGKAASGLGAMLDEAVEEAELENGDRATRGFHEAEQSLALAKEQLTFEIAKLGETVRSPSVVSDRWNLLSEVQAFRTRFREQIGGLVYRTASAFGDVSRKDVVPGHADEVRSAVRVRSTVADLSRVLAARAGKVRDAQPEDVQWNALQLEKEMDSFGKTPAYKALRAQDKRGLIEFRQQLRTLVADALPAKAQLVTIVEHYFEFIKGLAVVNNRQILIDQDRELWAASGVKLETAESLLLTDEESAAHSLSEAVALAQGLYGREPKLDSFLRKSRKAPIGSLAGGELQDAVNAFRELIAGLPVFDG